MIAHELDYRHEADADRWGIWIGRAVIEAMNARHFPADPADPPLDPRATMPPLRRRIYDMIAETGADGIVGPVLIARLGVDHTIVRNQQHKLLRAGLVTSAQEPGFKGKRTRWWAL